MRLRKSTSSSATNSAGQYRRTFAVREDWPSGERVGDDLKFVLFLRCSQNNALTAVLKLHRGLREFPF